MRVPAKNALSFARFCVAERPVCYLRGQPQPSGVEAVQVTGKTFSFEIDFLQIEVKELAELVQENTARDKAVKLMAMNGQVAFPLILPYILLVDRYAHQVRHNFRESVIVVTFYPHHFNLVPRIGEFPDVPQELPLLFGKPPEVQVTEDVAQ